MNANKVVLNNEVLVDLTQDTVTEGDVKQGLTFHKADGSQAVGTSTAIEVSGTKPITENGTHDVKEFESVEVNVESSGGAEPIPLNVTQNGVYAAPKGQAYSPVNVSVKDIELIEGDYSEEGYIKCVLDLPGAIQVGFNFVNDGTIDIDWGDGTTGEYTSGSQRVSHQYTVGGIYIVKMPITNYIQLGISSNMGFYSDFNFSTGYYLRKIYIDSPLVAIQALSAKGLTHCEIRQLSSIWNKAFYECERLGMLVIPEGITQLPTQVCGNCYALYKVVVPKTVMSILNNAFSICYRLAIIDFSQHESVPTLSSASAIYNATGQQILVPSALYDEWIAATNWSSIASRIVAV